jgi:hypothetical protein
MKITRWAKANPKKTQLLIAGLQLLLMAIGIFAGNNFKELGYEFSETSVYVFSAITIISFFSVNFLPKLRTIAIPKEVNRQRFAYMGIALSSFVMMVIFGNRLEDRYPNSFLTHVVKTIDQKVFPDNSLQQYPDLNEETSIPYYSNNYEYNQPGESTTQAVFASYSIYDRGTIIPLSELKKESKANLKAEKKAKKFEKKKTKLMNSLGKKRMSAAAGMSGGAVLLIILLVLGVCTGACLIAGGIALLIDGGIGGILAILGGVGIGWLCIREIGRVSKRDKEKQMNEPPKQKSELNP